MTGAKTALVAGAAGLVGGHLVRELVGRPDYSHITVLVRRKLNFAHPKLTQLVVDFDHLDTHADAFAVDDVYCCLGTTIKKAGSQPAFRRVDFDYPVAMGRLAKERGAQRFLIVTAMGANAGSSIFYNRVKGEVENALAELGLPALLIFRPSLLLGERQEHRFGERVAAAVTRVINPLLVGGLRKYRGIEGRTVARAMVAAAGMSATGLQVYESDRTADLGR